MRINIQKDKLCILKIVEYKKTTNVTIFDKEGNKLSLTETDNELNEEKISKELVTLLSRDNKNLLRDDNIENLYDIKNYK